MAVRAAFSVSPLVEPAERLAARRLALACKPTIRITSPTMTGKDPRSPDVNWSMKAQMVPARPVAWVTRVSARFRVGFLGSVISLPARYGFHGAKPHCGSLRWCTHKVMVRGFRREHPIVAPQLQYDDPVSHGTHFGHVVADHDDAQSLAADAIDKVQNLGGLRNTQGGSGFVQQVICGFSSSERAIATVWRWPPDREAMSSRTEGMRAASSLSRVQARTSIATSSLRKGFSSCPRKRLATASRFSHRARS